jgi:hypothetical protein
MGVFFDVRLSMGLRWVMPLLILKTGEMQRMPSVMKMGGTFVDQAS